MPARRYFFLFFVSLGVILGVAAFQTTPGYMDADYYFAVGLQLAEGQGFTEPFLWNYLDDPSGLPHPSHTYWMPLTSILAAVPMKLMGELSFQVARVGFMLLAALIAPLTALLSFQLTGDDKQALLAGLLGVFPGFYLPYLGTTDTFAISAVLGAVFFLLLPALYGERAGSAALSIGLLSGLFHLSRADGILWLGLSLLVVGLATRGQRRQGIRLGLLAICGYTLVMAPWLVRNLATTGALLSPGGLRTLWLVAYDEFFSYPASQLTVQHWFSQGIAGILEARWWSLGLNLQRSLAEQGMIFLTPLIFLGWWAFKRDVRGIAGFSGWVLAFSLMTVIFPFSGARGGLFHLCAAFQPFFWALAPAGLDQFIGWGERNRNWDGRQAWIIFGTGVLGMAVALSGAVVFQRVIGPSIEQPLWNQPALHYAELEAELQNLGANPQDLVLVNNPPGYYVTNRRSGIVIPNGDVATLLAVARDYGVRFILLESSHPQGLNTLYLQPRRFSPEIEYRFTLRTTHVFEVK